ncbi:MAG: formyltetrahydrofolate deformylase [Hadesarchaea archaeon]|nr:MAG: formyltetrahydrofolate deformylase [Hadesarchaea archaeon]
MLMETAILLLSCPDAKGIDARISSFIWQNEGNIVHFDQHVDEEFGRYFARVEWTLEDFRLPREGIREALLPLASELRADWRIHFSSERPRVGIMVSRHLHCLYDLLARWKEGRLRCEIPLIIGDKPDGEGVARMFGIPFHHLPVDLERREEGERRQIELLKREGVELVVLARYGKILSPLFVEEFRNRIISVHPSFLPAFPGKDPFTQAYRRGVKLIGATAHFVSEEVDEGPIIYQDVVRISHKDSPADLVRKSENLEKISLSEAVRLYCERRILVYENKTIVFE